MITNLIGSIAIFGIGLSYSFVSVFFIVLALITHGAPIAGNPLTHLFLFCLLVMCPLMFFLGQTLPLLLNTADQDARKSEATGNATAISTIGNVLGCLITPLVLMYFLGVGYSIFINLPYPGGVFGAIGRVEGFPGKVSLCSIRARRCCFHAQRQDSRSAICGNHALFELQY